MEKILDKDFRNEVRVILEESGYSGKEAYRIVLNRYKKSLKEGAVKILQQAITYLKEDRYEELSSMLKFSPAGDSMGCDNCYIDFSSLCSENEWHEKSIYDLGDVVEILKK